MLLVGKEGRDAPLNMLELSPMAEVMETNADEECDNSRARTGPQRQAECSEEQAHEAPHQPTFRMPDC
jgi:hypothetical protein